MLSAYLSECASCLWSGVVGDRSGELVAEVCGDCLWFGVYLAVEGDGLVRVLVWPLS